jgi:hypothetical protein
MGVDLINRNDDSLSLDHLLWARAREMAEQYGWKPAGTIVTYDVSSLDCGGRRPWNGNYTTNDYQKVTAKDADALGNALEKALDDIPDHKIRSGEFVDVSELVSELGERLNYMWVVVFAKLGNGKVPKETLNSFEYFSGDGKRLIKKLIAFCRKGEFVIG